MRVTTGNTTTWTMPSGFPPLRWTISLWTYTSEAWVHWVKIYGTTTLWQNGVAGEACPAWLTWNSTGITLAGDAGAARDYSEIVIWPFLAPTTWPATIYARAAALTKPPFVDAAGDFLVVPGTTSYTCRGQALQSDSQNRGALSRLQRIPFSLEES
jgi:hypothetical protein